MRLAVAALALAAGVAGSWALPASAREEAGLGGKERTRYGLRGEVYALEPNTRSLPDFSKLRPSGAIYTETLNVTPRDFRAGFPGVTNRYEWFGIDYRGTFRLAKPGRYRFRLTSDDGARLFIDEGLVINNDGLHPPAAKDAVVELRSGRHAIRVQYFQGPGSAIALVLELGREKGPLAPFDARQLAGESVTRDALALLLTVALLALLAFAAHRLAGAVAGALSGLTWTRGWSPRHARLAMLALSAIAGVAIAWITGAGLVAELAGVPAGAGIVLTGLLVGAGADLLHETHARRDRPGDDRPVSVTVTGRVVLRHENSGS